MNWYADKAQRASARTVTVVTTPRRPVDSLQLAAVAGVSGFAPIVETCRGEPCPKSIVDNSPRPAHGRSHQAERAEFSRIPAKMIASVPQMMNDPMAGLPTSRSLRFAGGRGGFRRRGGRDEVWQHAVLTCSNNVSVDTAAEIRLSARSSNSCGEVVAAAVWSPEERTSRIGLVEPPDAWTWLANSAGGPAQ